MQATITATEVTSVLEHMPYPIPESYAFEGARGFLPAADLERIATDLIAEHHQILGHLSAFSIVWLWKEKANKRGWTKAAKDLLGYFAEDVDFVIWLGADMLREEQFTHRQIRAQVFHELLHIALDPETGKVRVRADHDFEGYVAELEVFGPWTAELSRAKRTLDAAPAVGMGPLFDDERDGDVGV